MTGLPNAKAAVLEVEKLRDYCLNPGHPRGRHKARVFRSALGIDRTDAGWLRSILLAGARQQQALDIGRDEFGTRWRIDVPVTRNEIQAVVRTIWLSRTGEAAPRFVTCWVL